MLEVVCVPVLQDNYVWLIHDAHSGEVAAVDPAVEQPVLSAAAELGWNITQIWNTHWHPDHCGGNEGIKAEAACVVHAPAVECDRIPVVDRPLVDGDQLTLGRSDVAVLAVPGHTLGHVAYYLPKHGVVFTGDTLFAAGCGRVFEGTAEQMWSSLRRLMALPGDTLIYAAHEYTMSNLRFAQLVEPRNEAILYRLKETAGLRETGRPSLPTTITKERLTNPFCRAENVEAFARIRRQKDMFR
nr:hydroxyacylglutathione hydrolase [uncultured Steroidobacter sp.]